MTCSNLNNHVGFNHYQKIEAICKILFQNTAVNYFCHHRIYFDGFYMFLPTNPDLASYFYKDGVYPDTWLFNLNLDRIQNGVFLWDAAINFNSEKQNELSHFIEGKLKLKHGIDIIEKSTSYCDFYSFSSDERNIYNSSVYFLKRFIFYFKQEAQSLIKEAHHGRFFLPLASMGKIDFPVINFGSYTSSNEKDIFHTKKFFLKGKHDGIYLTEKESHVLKLISKGCSSKQGARILEISFRTFENHIAHIKDKLGCSKSEEAVLIAVENSIL